MVRLAIDGLDLSGHEVVVTILAEHERLFGAVKGIEEALDGRVEVVVLDAPTKSQAETVARTLELAKVTGPFLVKDSDNYFRVGALQQPYNYVCVDSLNNFDSINPRNKSYVQVDEIGGITNIREKEVISDRFSVGGYYFTSAALFSEYFISLSAKLNDWHRELYISDVIGAMILDGIPFQARDVAGYQDWGTVHEWSRALSARRTLFVLVDGFLLDRGSRYFQPSFSEVGAHVDAVAAVKAAVAEGHSVVYLSIRPAALEGLTMNQLTSLGLPVGPVVYDCPTTPWTLVTAPHPTLPFHTSLAMELAPDDPNVAEKLLAD